MSVCSTSVMSTLTGDGRTQFFWANEDLREFGYEEGKKL
jgi:hypothetical protein